MKKIFILFVVIGFLFISSPIFAENNKITPNQAGIISQLQEQIKALQAQLSQIPAEFSTTKEELRITKTLKLGMSDEEVKILQTFLSTLPNIYPEGLVTGYFGSLTEKAVKKWQEKNNIESVGIVGPITRAKIAETTSGGSSNVSTPVIAANINVNTNNSGVTTPLGATPATPANSSGGGGGGSSSTQTTPLLMCPTPGQMVTICHSGQTLVVSCNATGPEGHSNHTTDTLGACSTTPSTTHVITVTQGTNGTISPSTISVTSGGSQTFTITPASGYQTSNLVVDGSNVTVAETYTFSNVTTAHTLSAVFSQVIAAPHFLLKWGTADPLEFRDPRGIAVDSSGNVYVTNNASYFPKVQKYTSTGTFISEWGSLGAGDGQFQDPIHGIAIDSLNNVYVVDGDNSRLQKFTSNGVFITKWGSPGSSDGQFISPVGIAIDSSNNVYVSSGSGGPCDGCERIQKFTSSGTFITKWGSYGNYNYDTPFYGYFNMPRGMAFDSSGNIYVVDNDNSRIQKFTSGGTFITQLGSEGTGNNQFLKPTGIAVDSSDNIYVLDAGNYRILKFSNNGTFISKWGSFGTNDGQFNDPLPDMTIDSSGNVYVVDGGNQRIQKFSQSSITLLNPKQQFVNISVNDQLANVLVAFQRILDLMQELLKNR